MSLNTNVTEQQVAAAKLRVVLDQKLGRPTPELIRQIADASPSHLAARRPDNHPDEAEGPTSQTPGVVTSLPAALFTGRENELKQLSENLMRTADAARAKHDYAQALALYEQALRVSRENGDKGTVISALSQLATVHVAFGRIDDASAVWSDVIREFDLAAKSERSAQNQPDL